MVNVIVNKYGQLLLHCCLIVFLNSCTSQHESGAIIEKQCSLEIDYESLANQMVSSYLEYRDSIPRPNSWVSAQDCDIEYWVALQRVKNNILWKDFESTTCLNAFLNKKNISSISSFERQKEMIINFIINEDLKLISPPRFTYCNLDEKWQSLKELYSRGFEYCYRFHYDLGDNSYSQVCLFNTNMEIIGGASNLPTNELIFVLDHKTEKKPGCFNREYFIKYQFLDVGKKLEVKKILLNPSVIITNNLM